MSLSGTQEGGSLMFIDAANYSEHNTPANSTRAAQRRPGRGHRQAAQPGPRPLAVRPRHHALPAVGRHQPRAARYRPCEVTRTDGVVIPCVNLTADEIARCSRTTT